ncbi:hypothetical protein LTR95_010748, partial [Oleoguttula sp. CCFEE 5521]
MMLLIEAALLSLAFQVTARATPRLHARDDNAAKSSARGTSSPTFVPYVQPTQKIEEFIALGDSYTAGTGSNGQFEAFAGDAARGRRAYPMQMATNAERWASLNGGDRTLPRLSFHAYTGDLSTDVSAKQLKPGDFADDKVVRRNQPFGKPQVAVMTLGGNDMGLSNVLSACIYRAWSVFDQTCDDAIAEAQATIDSAALFNHLTSAMADVAYAGRDAGGASPRESFQTYVLSYVSFFNDQDPKCDTISWNLTWGPRALLTTTLRRRLNVLVENANALIEKVVQNTEMLGVISVDGLDELYNGHRFCEPGHTETRMIDHKTWFWSRYSNYKSSSEGKGDPTDANASDDQQIESAEQAILDFVFPGQNRTVSETSIESPPWTWPGAE